MLLVGLTGNIASGKTTVSRLLAARGVPIIDADVLSREAVLPGTQAFERIVKRWGPEILAHDGSIDRAKLRRIVFADRGERDELNNIVHPEVNRRRRSLVNAARARGESVVVSDIALLFEAGLVSEFDAVILVDAPREMRRERIMRDRGLSGADADAMIDAQMPAELKRAGADYVIENTGTKEELIRQIDEIWRELEATRDANA